MEGWETQKPDVGVWLRLGGYRKGESVGNDLLSHAATRILPSVLVDLTAGFEMGPGVPPPLQSPTTLSLILKGKRRTITYYSFSLSYFCSRLDTLKTD